jgi:WD40 repeat protein/Ca2+-binding EF-hand superfamily protein
VRFDPSDVCSILSNGPSVAIFWSWHEGQLSYYAPPLGERDFKQPVGSLTQSVFIPGTRKAVSATSDGDAVLWDCVELPEVASTDRRATKLIRLHSGPLLSLLTVGEMLVSGGQDGHVRFFDFDFRVVAWFEDLDAGPISSISFAHQPAALKTPGEEGAAFSCPDFVVGTSNALVVACTSAMFEQIHADARRGTLLVQGQDAPVHGLAAHPSLTRFACTGHSGLLQLWDYAEKRLLLMRMFDKLLGHALAFSPNGKLLAVGFTNGTLKLLAGMTLEEICTFRSSRDAVTHLAFSSDSAFLASADADRCVALYRHGASAEGDGSKREWEYTGKYRAHHAPISGLSFGDGSDGLARLFSVGEDAQLVEFDLQRSSVSGGVQLRKATRIEQSAAPTSCLWLGSSEGRAEPLVVVANDRYKLRQVAADSKAVEATVLGPTYGGPISSMAVLPTLPADADAEAAVAAPRHVAYATQEKVVGLLQLPLDGNPNKGMGLVAHPGEVSAMVVSWDGAHLITAGGSDLAIHMWDVTPQALEPTVAAGGGGLAPYLALLEGGAGGALHQEMRDYFYYAQLRAQGEDTTEPRRITGRVPISELGNLMRALGYYPSEREIDELCHEARVAQQAAGGEHADSIDFDGFVKLYVNHRPVFGVGKEAIAQGFAAIGADANGVGKEQLMRALANHGEALSPEDLAQCLRALTGHDDLESLLGPKQQIDAPAFAEKILGFEDYDS